MLITFHCATCRSKLEVEAEYAGTAIACPQCDAPLTIPKPKLGPGMTIGGFRIEGPLGRGGMGEVYLARQLCLDRLVALKILPSHLSADSESTERFINEMRLLANVKHQNIVTAYEAGNDSGVLFLAMAYIPGQSLELRLQEHGPLSQPEALQVTRRLAAALSHAWDTHHLLHRDIKPSNVLFDTKGEPKLVDFGLAKSLDETLVALTRSTEVLGTPNYMSPERIDGAAGIGVQADMYALGATLYHMLTGQLPFMAGSVMETLRKQATGQLAAPQALNPNVSEYCAGLISVMMAKDPAQRHESWDALIADIDRVLTGGPAEHALPAPEASTVAPFPDAPQTHDDPPNRAPDVLSRWRTELRENLRPILAGAVLAVIVIAASAWVRQHLRQASAKTPPATPPPEASAPAPTPVPLPPLLDELKSDFDRARQYAEEHPEDYSGTLARFQQLKLKAQGTEVEQQAGDQVRKVGERRQAALTNTLAQLKSQVAARLDSGQFKDALELLDRETGAFAAELASTKAELRQSVLQKETEEKRKQEEAEEKQRLAAQRAAAKSQGAAREREAKTKLKREAETALAAAVETAASCLLKGDIPTAVRQFTALRREHFYPPYSNKVENAAAFLERLAGMPQIVLASFEAEKGTEVTVDFKSSDPEKLLILGVFEDKVKAQRPFPGGYVQRNFTVADLSPSETWKRLGTSQGPELTALRGILAAQGGYWEKAADHFAQVENPIGRTLHGVAAGNAAEKTAQLAFLQLLRAARITVDPKNTELVLKSIGDQTYTEEQAERIQAALSDFNTRFAVSELARLCRPVLDKLAAVARPAFPAQEPADDQPAGD